MKYCGWENYQTWCAFSWLSNDKKVHTNLIGEAKSFAMSTISQHKKRVLLMPFIQREVRKLVDCLNIPDNGMMRDLLEYQIKSIDFYNIAKHYIELE